MGRATVGRDEDMEQRIEEARAVLAALLVADPSEIVLAPGIDAALAQIGHMSNSRDATFLDVSLKVGAEPFEAASLGVDFLAFAATNGCSVRSRPPLCGSSPHAGSSGLVLASATGLSRTAVLGLARSVGWLEMYAGLEWAYARTASSVTFCGSCSGRFPGWDDACRVGPSAFHCGGVVSRGHRRRIAPARFRHRGLTPHGQSIRASGLVQHGDRNPDVCGRGRDIAANTPVSIPRRLPLLGE